MIDQETTTDGMGFHEEVQFALREALSKNDKSQADLARMIGVTNASISNTLKLVQRSTWRISTIERIFIALGYKMHLTLEKIDD